MAKIPVTDCPAGPALDAAVAQELGHLVAHQPDFGRWFIASDADALQEGLKLGEFWEDITDPDRVRYCSTMPKYSARIAAALELWTELAENHYVVSVCYGPGGDSQVYASVQMQLDVFLAEDLKRRDPTEMDAEAETIPLAITRAFLLAHGVTEVEVPDD